MQAANIPPATFARLHCALGLALNNRGHFAAAATSFQSALAAFDQEAQLKSPPTDTILSGSPTPCSSYSIGHMFDISMDDLSSDSVPCSCEHKSTPKQGCLGACLQPSRVLSSLQTSQKRMQLPKLALSLEPLADGYGFLDSVRSSAMSHACKLSCAIPR
jgi:hypothetical protein